MNYNNQLDTETENETKILEEDNDPYSYSDIDAEIEFESEKEEMGNQLEEHFQSGEIAKKTSFDKVVSSSTQTQSHPSRSGK